jgi:hypothetical protein
VLRDFRIERHEASFVGYFQTMTMKSHEFTLAFTKDGADPVPFSRRKLASLAQTGTFFSIFAYPLPSFTASISWVFS